eukprot:scaffold295899_cov32-Tisochrysis_lutea.AAC.1
MPAATQHSLGHRALAGLDGHQAHPASEAVVALRAEHPPTRTMPTLAALVLSLGVALSLSLSL